MEKIVLIANISKPASEIFNSLSKKYETKMQRFNKEALLTEIPKIQPFLIIVYSKELSRDDVIALHAVFSDYKAGKFPVLFIGNEKDYKDYILPSGGNVVGCLLTPTVISVVMDKVKLLVAAIHKKNGDEVPDEIPVDEFIVEEEFMPEIKKIEHGENEKKDEKKHVMIVDDDPVTLRMMMNILKDEYKTTVAKSGAAAMLLLGSQKPDLILLDYLMPICDGLQIFQMIRSEENTKDIPVFFLTGVDDSDCVRNAMSLKPEGYILKNTRPTEILRRIGDFFEQV